MFYFVCVLRYFPARVKVPTLGAGGPLGDMWRYLIKRYLYKLKRWWRKFLTIGLGEHFPIYIYISHHHLSYIVCKITFLVKWGYFP